jgi:AcrR family transcriptional regulator
MAGAVNANRRPGPGRPSEGARDALVAAARELFAGHGYDSVSTAMLLAKAGVSRGAMYHHFAGKRELFEALYVELEDELMARLAAAAGGASSPLEGLRAGSRAYLRECERPGDWARINLRQSREVLGADRWQELAADRGIGAVRAAIAAAMDAGETPDDDASVVASVYLAALIEAGLQVARAADSAETRAAAERTLDRLLDGLAQAPGGLEPGAAADG